MRDAVYVESLVPMFANAVLIDAETVLHPYRGRDRGTGRQGPHMYGLGDTAK